MPGNTFGKLFRLTSFGESHGKAIGGIIDGCPSGMSVDIDFVQQELDRRRPGQSLVVSSRKELDSLEILSGVFNGKTTGTPIGFLVWNKDQNSKDYSNLKDIYRPSHADYTYDVKYGNRDYKGGGRSSAREHIARVVAGAFAKLYLRKYGITITAYTSKIGALKLKEDYKVLDFSCIEDSAVRCPDSVLSIKMIDYLTKLKEEGDSIGGQISCVISNLPVGLGEPVFDRLNANLAKAMMSINAAKGFELGSGFSCTSMRGSEHNDVFYKVNDIIKTKTNFSGGIQGGISNGEDVYFNVAFKPIATLERAQMTVDRKGEEAIINVNGRHDSCVVPRAVPVVEAMAAIVILDAFLESRVFGC